MPVAFLFPGQNSRYPAMLEKMLSWDPANQHLMERASDTLGRDLKSHFKADNPCIFQRNRDVQIAVFLANHMHWQSLERAGVRADYSAGLSLGEYNHLVHIGALEFEEALRVLTVRGEAYDAAPRGRMTAVYPLSVEDIEGVLAKMDCKDKLALGMKNTPQQYVLSGERESVDAAVREVEEQFFAQSSVVDEGLPMHSPLFRAVGEELRPALEQVPWQSPARPYLSNVKGDFVSLPAPADFVEALACHPWQTVRWRESMERLVAAAAGLVMVETGPKAVLTRFFSKRWLNPRRYCTDSEDASLVNIERIAQELAGAPSGIANAN
jgi:[acyl-carrier-protein] S-malonyltransferase